MNPFTNFRNKGTFILFRFLCAQCAFVFWVLLDVRTLNLIKRDFRGIPVFVTRWHKTNSDIYGRIRKTQFKSHEVIYHAKKA